jgi:hydrogenase nickel incorporation protein HypA/HybF
MHELSIASAIVERVLRFLGKEPVTKVLSVKLAIGELSHLEAEQLRFCYMAITKQTLIQDSILEIEKVEAIVRCDQCSYRGRPQYWDEALAAAPILTLQCPNCGGTVEIIEGNDCVVKSIRVEDENELSATSGTT